MVAEKEGRIPEENQEDMANGWGEREWWINVKMKEGLADWSTNNDSKRIWLMERDVVYVGDGRGVLVAVIVAIFTPP